MNSPKPSVMPTYDASQTGPRYHVTAKVDGRVVVWEQPIDDPFIRTTVVLGWRDLLRGLLRRELAVTVLVGADKDMVDDVLELNADALVTGRRRASDFRRTILDGFNPDD